MLSSQTTQVLDLIKRGGTTTPGELAIELGISTVAVHKHLRRLLADGVVVKKGSAPKVRYRYKYKSSSQIEAERADLHKFLLASKVLFWDIPANNLAGLSDEAIVERIIELGDQEQVKFVTTYFKSSLPRIYKSFKSKRRSNLSPESLAFLNNYINYHVK